MIALFLKTSFLGSLDLLGLGYLLYLFIRGAFLAVRPLDYPVPDDLVPDGMALESFSFSSD